MLLLISLSSFPADGQEGRTDWESSPGKPVSFAGKYSGEDPVNAESRNFEIPIGIIAFYGLIYPLRYQSENHNQGKEKSAEIGQTLNPPTFSFQ
jgi:hypothetical protein